MDTTKKELVILEQQHKIESELGKEIHALKVQNMKLERENNELTRENNNLTFELECEKDDHERDKRLFQYEVSTLKSTYKYFAIIVAIYFVLAFILF